MSATCPSCGVAVVPGYVRCPKCHKPLPRTRAAVEGGTVVEPRGGFPVLAVVGAVVIAGGMIAFFALRGDDDKPAAAPPPPPAPEVAAPETGPVAGPTPQVATAPVAPDPIAVAADLERALKREKLWSTVEVIGGRVDVRSGSCSEAAMAPLLAAAAPSLKAAGLTKLRCLEQSGRVVTDRDL